MDFLSNALSIVSSVAALAAAPAAVAVGVVPRLGPGRAAALALTSRLFSRAAPASQRVGEVAALRRMLTVVGRDQYIVVAGPRGVGKTCIVETATQATCGVVTVRVPAGTHEKEILADVLTALARYYVRALDQSGSARRVLWWHALLFRTPATVVLQAAERKPAQAFADLDSAARALARDFGVRVVVDASDNALPGAALATLREMVLEVEPMPRATLEALPELAPLLAALRAARLADVVWAVAGGVPAHYLQLSGQWGAHERRDVAAAVAAFALGALKKAVNNVGDAVAADARLQALYDRFRGADVVPYSALKAAGLSRPSPDKVLRAVFAIGAGGAPENALVPADAATAIVLRWGLAEVPAMDALVVLLAARARGARL
jgi:hypothetical protein